MNTPAVNPISTFEPTVGAHAHDVLNADGLQEKERERLIVRLRQL